VQINLHRKRCIRLRWPIRLCQRRSRDLPNQNYGGGLRHAKRFGASYADTATSAFIGNAVLPSLLKQDPRYFYKGIGSTRSRILYAIANSVICKGNNQRWQPNYSAILGGLAAGGISNLYYQRRIVEQGWYSKTR
jgi:hypothetical protein